MNTRKITKVHFFYVLTILISLLLIGCLTEKIAVNDSSSSNKPSTDKINKTNNTSKPKPDNSTNKAKPSKPNNTADSKPNNASSKPKPTVSKEKERWFELPAKSSLKNILFVSHKMPDNPEVRNYSMLYDTINKLAYWVAYPIASNYLNEEKGIRTNKWAYDPEIPIYWQPNLKKGIETGIDRGHQIPSADRATSKEANSSTFYFSNMTAQDSKLNQTLWSNLEKKVRKWADQCDTLYVVTGASITTKEDLKIEYVQDNKGADIAKPKYYYKALVQRKNNEYTCIAFKINNEKPETVTDYSRYMLTVNELEKETGFTFFPNLPHKGIKKNIDTIKWK